MARLHVRLDEVKANLSWSLLCSSIFVFSLLALPVAAVAQTAAPEVEEPLTAEDIAAGVTAVQALAKDKAKVEAYCKMVDMVDDAQPAEGKTMAPEAESALDAEVDKALATLGEDFGDAYYALDELPEKDPMGAPLVAAFEELDKACGGEDEAPTP